ncbi:hypothetical protein RF11_15716 [Thelohanellus kitauei]|uniref:Uncharacterized protein n=1 Tax=Thelohanellus kitauei TaxID=669202 RepID=A0A0C2JKK4_THEKT|nr:hypothetical protein RF11_15716 [Thelohanellus kitauei]
MDQPTRIFFILVPLTSILYILTIMLFHYHRYIAPNSSQVYDWKFEKWMRYEYTSIKRENVEYFRNGTLINVPYAENFRCTEEVFKVSKCLGYFNETVSKEQVYMWMDYIERLHPHSGLIILTEDLTIRLKNNNNSGLRLHFDISNMKDIFGYILYEKRFEIFYVETMTCLSYYLNENIRNDALGRRFTKNFGYLFI